MFIMVIMVFDIFNYFSKYYFFFGFKQFFKAKTQADDCENVDASVKRPKEQYSTILQKFNMEAKAPMYQKGSMIHLFRR